MLRQRTVFPVGIMVSSNCMGTHMCYEEDVVHAVLPAGTFISDNAHIWGHTCVRSCD